MVRISLWAMSLLVEDVKVLVAVWPQWNLEKTVTN